MCEQNILIYIEIFDKRYIALTYVVMITPIHLFLTTDSDKSQY